MLVIVLIVILATLLLWLQLDRTKNDYWKERNVPCLEPTSYFGSLRDIFTASKSIGMVLLDIYNTFPDHPFTGFYSFNQPAILIRDPDIIRHILIKDFNHFTDRTSGAGEDIDPLSSLNVFGLKGERWKIVRSRLTPMFSSNRIKNMTALIMDKSQNLDRALAKACHGAGVIDVKDTLLCYTTDVIASCAFGVDENSLEDPNTTFRTIIRRFFEEVSLVMSVKINLAFFMPSVLRLLGVKPFDVEMHDTMRKIVWRNLEYRAEHGVVRGDFLDLLADIRRQTKEEAEKDGGKTLVLDGDLLVAQAFVFLLAAIHPTAGTMSHALVELAVDQDLQEKVRKEINDVLSDSNGITYDSVQKMTLLDRVLNETLRKYPTLSFLDRVCNKRYQIPGTDVVVEPGVTVFISLLGMQKNGEVFVDPDVFDPERFSAENVAKRDRMNHMPFGEGPRSCIGVRFGQFLTKIGIIEVLRGYRLERCAQTEFPLRFNTKTFFTVVDHDILLKVTPFAQ